MLKGIKSLLLGLLTVGKHLFKRQVTLEYPEKRPNVPENYRGKIVVDGCIKCMNCTKVCPSGAIKIEDKTFTIDLEKCIFCGNCMYYCPVGAIKCTNDFELATQNKNDLKLTYFVGGDKDERID